MTEYGLHSEFDIDKHRETFINYLEVIISEDGKIHYAVPSHQEYLINECMRQYDWCRQEVYDNTPVDYYGDVIIWLCKMTGSVSVWNDFLQFYQINQKQFDSLVRLKNAGLYNGDMPDHPMSFDEYRVSKFGDFEIW